VRFGPFTLDRDTRQLTDEQRVIALSPKAFELLLVLVDEHPRAVSKSELQERLWPKTFVAEANLSNLIAEIRKALRDRRRTPAWIRTVHGFGYAFCGETVPAGVAESLAGRPVCWLAWGRRQFALSLGEHVIGRDRHADIQLDLSTVSRRHARLVVGPDGTTLEDCGSKNGTWHGDQRIAAPLALVDGDDIRIGSVRLTFHLGTAMRSTETVAEAMP